MRKDTSSNDPMGLHMQEGKNANQIYQYVVQGSSVAITVTIYLLASLCLKCFSRVIHDIPSA